METAADAVMRRGGARLLACCVLAVLAEPTCAQESPAMLPAIIVTARKREERSQDVPISIATLSGKQLESSHSYLPAEALQTIPNVQLQFVNPRQTAFAIRGLGNNPAGEGLETSVGVYLDGVYLSRPGMLTTDLYDIEQVTALRGPQGTLFGKNTTAGALSIATRKPEQTIRSDVEISTGRFGLAQIRGSVTGPLSSRVSGRLSVFDTSREGTLANQGESGALNDLDKKGARAQLYFQNGDAFDLRFIGDFTRQHESAVGQVLVDPGLILADGSVRPNNVLVRSARFDFQPTFDPFARRANIDQRQSVETTSVGTSLEANWKHADYALTSISAWRSWEFLPGNDLDFLPLDVQHAGGSDIRNRQLSQEFRIASPLAGPLDFVAGVFLYGQQVDAATAPGATYGADAARFFSQPNLLLPAYALEGLTSATRADVRMDSYAVFGQTSWHLNSRWNLTAGARSTWDYKKALVSRTRSGGVALNPADPFFAAATAARNQVAPRDATSNNESSGNTLSGSLSLGFEPSDAFLFYGSLNRGVKAAGLNTNILPAGADPRVGPEVAKDIELGVKTTFLDERIQLDADVFWTDIDNYQTTVRDRVLFVMYLANAKSARTRGAELDLHWLVVDGLQLDTTIGYDEAEYTSFHDAPCGAEWAGIATSCDLTRRPIAGAPRWSGHVRGEYEHSVGGSLQGRGGIEYTARSSSYATSEDSAYTLIAGYGLVNLHVGIGAASGSWEVSLWARNLLDRQYFAALSASGVFGAGYVTGIVGDPRTYGLTLRMRL
jgi:iron complex outermembrane receptor protein